MPMQKMRILIVCFFTSLFLSSFAQHGNRILGLYHNYGDQAHISFIADVKKWLPKEAEANGWEYVHSRDWSKLNPDTLVKYRLVLFLDGRPEEGAQRRAFEKYVKQGGAWIGFHFSAFALTPSAYPDDWPWYQDTLLGCGSYKSNVWRAVPALLQKENSGHPVLRNLPDLFWSAPNEWYRWERDLRANPSIQILLSIDAASYPLGTGPKPYEIWQEGYYPVVWTNRQYRMLYVNMGHNDMDYGGTNLPLSHSFDVPEQAQLLHNALKWLMSGH